MFSNRTYPMIIFGISIVQIAIKWKPLQLYQLMEFNYRYCKWFCEKYTDENIIECEEGIWKKEKRNETMPNRQWRNGIPSARSHRDYVGSTQNKVLLVVWKPNNASVYCCVRWPKTLWLGTKSSFFFGGPRVSEGWVSRLFFSSRCCFFVWLQIAFCFASPSFDELLSAVCVCVNK